MHTYIEVIYVFDFPNTINTLRKLLINTQNMLMIQVHPASLNKSNLSQSRQLTYTRL